MCGSSSHSGQSEGKGQGDDLTGWGNPLSFCTNRAKPSPQQAISRQAIRQWLFLYAPHVLRATFTDWNLKPSRSTPAVRCAEWARGPGTGAAAALEIATFVWVMSNRGLYQCSSINRINFILPFCSLRHSLYGPWRFHSGVDGVYGLPYNIMW